MDDPKAIINAYIDNELTEDQLRELAIWMCETPENRRRFITDCYLHSQLQDIFAGEKIAREAAEPADADRGDDVTAVAPSGFISFASGICHDTLGFFSQEIPFALLIATFITSLGLVAGSMIYVTHHQPLASDVLQPNQKAVPEKTEYVGQVTGMVNVLWADDSTAALNGAGVPLGRKYALASGLMEITYHTGAKVILQGPVTYEVDSRDGGYLSIGKLTARLEKKGAEKKGAEVRGQGSEKVANGQSLVASDHERVASGQWPVASGTNPKSQIAKSKISNPQSIIPNPFTIHTPTATIIDLGTEFGVDVDKNGTAQVHVYEGKVISQSKASRNGKAETVYLKAGEAVQFSPQQQEHVSISFTPRRFIRKLSPWSQSETSYMDVVLADKPLAYWPLNERPNAWEFADRTGHGFHGHASEKITAGKQGPFGIRSYAVELNGHGGIDVYLGPEREKTIAELKALTVESWIWIGKGDGIGHILSADGQWNGIRSGWGLGYASYASQLLLTKYSVENCFLSNVKALPKQQWLHVVMTQGDSNAVRFYINGQLRQSLSKTKPCITGSVQLAIGRIAAGGQSWQGRLSHIAVYDRALTDQEIHSHFQASLEEGEQTIKENP